MASIRSEFGRLVFKKYHAEIHGPLAAWISRNPNTIRKWAGRALFPGDVSLNAMRLQFMTNVVILSSTVTFDAVIHCEVGLREWTFEGARHDAARQWYRVSCSATVEETIIGFAVHNICVYARTPETTTFGKVDKNLVPILSGNDLDIVAAHFLAEYCPEALEAPMPVPIEQIILEKMCLTLIKNGCLSEDLLYLGQMCLFPILIKVYDILCEGTEDVRVGRGSVVIDAMTYLDGNIGRVNFTIAHEAIHWYLHRVYATIKSILCGGAPIAYRCPAKPTKPNSGDAQHGWTDEERMEWQANSIAPRILMPAQMFKRKVEEYFAQYGYDHNKNGQEMILARVIAALADFFVVSKQAAKIRMRELGYIEADGKEKAAGGAPYFTKISNRDAFYEYCDNADFRAVIDSGLFRYVEGQYIIDDEKYIRINVGGLYELTDYARSHLGECALRFTYRRVDMKNHGQFHTDTFHRTNKNAYEKLPSYTGNVNGSVIDNAEELKQNRELFERVFKDYSAFATTFWQKTDELMKQRNWYPATFKDKTLLNDMDYSRYMTERSKPPSLARVMAICIGLDIDQQIAEDLLASAGYKLSPSREHQAYRFALGHYRGRIDECNDFLMDSGIKPLGSQSRQ